MAMVTAPADVSVPALVPPGDATGWVPIASSLTEAIRRGDNMSDVQALLAVLRGRDTAQQGAVLSRLADGGAVSAIASRLRAPLPVDMPPGSVWWREVCLGRMTDLLCLVYFVSCVDAVKSVAPHRLAIVRALHRTMTSAPLMHVFRVRQITTEVLLWLVALSPDFDAFSAIHQQGLLPILYDLISGKDSPGDRQEWVVYDLNSPSIPFVVELNCIRVVTFYMSECNYVLGSPSATDTDRDAAKAALLQCESVPFFEAYVEAIRRNHSVVNPVLLHDALQQFHVLWVFGGRTFCLRRENGPWADHASQLMMTALKSVSVPPDVAASPSGVPLASALESMVKSIVSVLERRRDPSCGPTRQAIHDLRQGYRLAVAKAMSQASAPPTPGTDACARCGARPSDRVALKRCGRCGTAQYCSVECQQHDWKVGGHKLRCRRATPP
ncbi:MYND-type domain-containing protein [Plasmodiophora brassicae]|uniref:MYND-type domain-containing protein n=1 Tax=Plasmodiophora brassicae TaxID=37360 RepID=A0A0G4INW8_PLABS|nr:hypothetical protein PBRA_005466 [Plasmodiophora brassicae]SPR01820.1 unnamed protein product [Plasmodiophora brassicae]